MKVRADEITHALSKRHTNDLFLTEVKNGPTMGSGTEMYRLDAVGVKKSWTSPCITGYEVKVDRQDFLNDDKWPAYREYCHRLFFACPKGLIEKDELPEDVGLIWFNPEKGTTYTRKKPLFRDVGIPTDMIYYILLSRLESEKHPFFSEQREMAEAYVNDKANRIELSKKLHSKMVEDLRDLHQENAQLRRKQKSFDEKDETLDNIMKLMREHGLSGRLWSIERELNSLLNQSLPDETVRKLERIVSASKEVETLLQGNSSK